VCRYALAAAPTVVKTKRLYLIRHGRTEMNDYLADNHWAVREG
jgi:hypothetical protein